MIRAGHGDDLRRRWRRSAAITALAVAAALLSALPSAARPGRLVAVGDVHGDLDALLGILREAGIVDEAGEWSGGDATFVQTGDFLDRGPRCREVMDFLRRLPAGAREQGGQAVVLLGNHEVMNLLGDLRYVTPDNFAAFAGKDPKKRQDAAWKRYVRYRGRQARRLGLPEPQLTTKTEAAWREAHPPGFFQQREAMGPDGDYGRWLRGLPVAAERGGTFFVHGGISPALAGRSAEQIRDRVVEELALWDRYRRYLVEHRIILPFFTLDEIFDATRAELDALEDRDGGAARQQRPILEAVLESGNWSIQHRDGPLWFRGYADWSEEEGAAEVPGLLEGAGVGRFVVGHTLTEDHRIHSRFGGAVFLIDTGMLSSYYRGGRASALEIERDRVTAVYRGERATLWEGSAAGANTGRDGAPSVPGPVWRGPEGARLPFRDDEEVLEFLRTARVVSSRSIRTGITQPQKLLLEKVGVRLHAIFRDVDIEETRVQVNGRREMFFRDSYRFEPAAYELARMLGVGRVPPAVLRKVGATPGSVQIWVEDTITEEKRRETSIQPPDIREWNRQMQMIHLFDALIYNSDRNGGNLLIDAGWRIWMIDHTRAFRLTKDLPDAPGFAQCDRETYRRLQDLDPEAVRRRLRPYLRREEIEALLERRDRLVEYVRSLVEERGDDAVLFAPAPSGR